MRGQILIGCPFGAALYDVPHRPLRYAASPGLACAADAPENVAFAHAIGHPPGIDGALDPIRNAHGPNMSAPADQIDDCPVALPPLKMGKVQFCRLFAARPATQEDSEQRSIPLAFMRIRVRHMPERLGLVDREQLPRRTRMFFGPLTRRMLAAKSGLKRPEPAASYASRRTAGSLPLIVPGAS